MIRPRRSRVENKTHRIGNGLSDCIECIRQGVKWIWRKQWNQHDGLLDGRVQITWIWPLPESEPFGTAMRNGVHTTWVWHGRLRVPAIRSAIKKPTWLGVDILDMCDGLGCGPIGTVSRVDRGILPKRTCRNAHTQKPSRNHACSHSQYNNNPLCYCARKGDLARGSIKGLVMTSFASGLHRGHWYGWIFWGVAAFFFLYEYFIRVMPSVIMKELGCEFDASPVELSAALATYLWVYAPLQLVVGGFFDKFGAKFLVAGAALICGGGGIVFGMAGDLHGVALAEGMIGIGSAFAFIGALYVATVWFPPSRLALIAGITTAVGILGQIIGQTPLEEAVKAFDWRTVVLATGWIGIGLAVLLFVVIPPRPSWFHERFSEEEHVEYSILRGILHVLGTWKVWVVGIISATLFLPLSVVAAMWGDAFMETAGGYTADEASFATIMLALGWLIGSPLVGIVSDRLGSRKWPLLIGSVGGGVAMLLFLWPSMFGYYGLLALMLVGGLFTSTQVICFAVVMELSPKVLRGTAAACNNFITMLIAAGLQVSVGWILTEEMISPALHPGQKHAVKAKDMIMNATPEEFRLAMMLIPALFVVAFILCLILPETAPGSDPQKDATPLPVGH